MRTSLFALSYIFTDSGPTTYTSVNTQTPPPKKERRYNIEKHPEWHQSTRTRATAKKPTSVKTAHPVETRICYNIA